MPSEAVQLSLRTWPEEDVAARSLRSLIPRISKQRGHLRNINEEDLAQEVQALEAASGDQPGHADDGQPGDGDDGGPDRTKDVMAAREEIVKQIGQAHEEALRALDFVSLLLSRETPRQAEISMSPYLKQHVPLASLGADTMQPPAKSEAKLREHDQVARGWKLQSLYSAADSLLSSATRLEKEIELETRYWEQVLAVSDKGWSVCQLPREKHTLGVRFGFSEATGSFKDRGLAALRRSEDGTISLDQGVAGKQPRAVRVRMKDAAGSVTGTSSVPSSDTDDKSIEDRILLARNTIYEEELFYELGREARLLANQGVRIIESTIAFSFPERQVLIDLVALDSESVDDGPSGADNSLAEGVVLSLRILLSYAHRQNLHRRSQLPPPLTERKRPTPSYFLLRPLLTHFFHRAALQTIRAFLSPLSTQLHSAGLTFKYDASAGADSNPIDSTRTLAESVIEKFIDRRETSIAITLPGSVEATLRVRTQLHAPVFGTDFLVTTTTSADLDPTRRPPRSIAFNSEGELRRYIQHVTTLALVAEIAADSSSPPSGDTRMASSDVPTDAPGAMGWKASAQLNELQKGFQKTGKSKRLMLRVSDDSVEMRWAWMGGARPGRRDGGYVWDGRDTEDKKTLREVVEEAGKFDLERDS